MARARKSGLAVDGISKCPTGIQGSTRLRSAACREDGHTCVRRRRLRKTLLGMEFLVRGAHGMTSRGLRSFEETAEELAQNMRSLGFRVNALVSQKKLIIDHVQIERSMVRKRASTTWRRCSFGSARPLTPWSEAGGARQYRVSVCQPGK